MENNLLNKEKEKYNLLHKLSGFETNQAGYGRQLQLLLNSDLFFFKFWRETNSTRENVILDIGLGAGETVKYFLENKYNFYGIDISDYVIDELKNILKTDKLINCSAHDIKLPSKSCDIVQHLDGFEHIPQEIEVDCLRESVRISRKYIFHAIACTDAYWDHILNQRGFDNAHINIKKPEEWLELFKKYSSDLKYSIYHNQIVGDTLYVILKIEE